MSYLLKELSQEIEMGCWWYGWIKHYLDMKLKTVFKTINCFLIYNFKFFTFFRATGIAQSLPFLCNWGDTLANVP
jgi:hypothetical protein